MDNIGHGHRHEAGSRTGRARAVVVGGSIAGLCAARVLADRFEEVVVVEPDELSGPPTSRRAVPQGRHAHGLLIAGARRMERWFPGLEDELLDAGALPLDPCADIYWHHFGVERVRFPSGLQVPLCSRPLLEHTVRARVLSEPNVALYQGRVERLVADAGATAVTGVRLDGGQELSCQLVVDASGRACRSSRWLTDLGYGPPPTSTVTIDMGYATRVFRRPPDDGREFAIALVYGEPPSMRMGVAFAQERGDTWMVTLAGFHGDHAGTDDAGWLAFARSLASPAIADIAEECEPLTPVVTHRLPSNLRRHVERMRRVPGGLVLLGDAVASFNPIYGQGMSSAAAQAEALAVTLDRRTTLDAGFVRSYNRRVAKAVNTPWQLSVGADFSLPQTTGPKPRGTDVMGRYMAKVLPTTQTDPVVARRFIEVMQLIRPPQSLLTPVIARRVLLGPRRSTPGATPSGQELTERDAAAARPAA